MVGGSTSASTHPSTLLGYVPPPDVAAALAEPVAPAKPRADQTEQLTNDEFQRMSVTPPPAPAESSKARADQTEQLTNAEFERMSVTPPDAPLSSSSPRDTVPSRADQTEQLTNAEFERMSVTPPSAPGLPSSPSTVASSAAPAEVVAPVHARDVPLVTAARREDFTDVEVSPAGAEAGGAMRWLAVPVALVVVVVLVYFAWTHGEAGTSPPAASSVPAPSAVADGIGTPAPAVAPSQGTATAPASAADASVAQPASSATLPPAAPDSPAASEAPSEAGVLSAARLDALAPLPPVSSRIARLRDSVRTERASRAIRTTSRAVHAQHWDDAAGDYTQALTYDPTRVEALVGMARVDLGRGHAEAALAWCQRALAADDASVSALMLRGDVLLVMGNPAAAREAWTRVVSIDGRNRDARARLRRNPVR